MTAAVTVKTYPHPALDPREILRYARCGGGELPPEAAACIESLPADLAGRVVFAYYDIAPVRDGLSLGFAETGSEDLAKCLRGCGRIALFCATAGVVFDRLVRKYERLSPSRALWYQAIGAAYVESVCDAFCADLKKEFGAVRPRFSPGYGDLPLALQTEIFAALDCPKNAGVTLDEHLFMIPSKSVTAIVGIGGREDELH